ncbi:acetyl-CoA synthase subunit gamma [candidate division KSB1 bacterium]|nr:acetyl-CoA synthase subunit gamma [candidate division KSB1 bacterium]MBL7095514.1 acetyl-CoA synthase subunit gamma [candidate division KSB1 bacterium]
MLYKELIVDYIDTPKGKIPVVPNSLNFQDLLGTLKVRLNVGRMKYSIEPGLYAVGQPGENAPVMVTANYKLTFDALRKELENTNAWILVLDTKGINVWCAAGKGTFGTKELVKRIKETGLDKIVNHRKLLVPQLGAVGVSAHKVKNISGFKVIYGPIRAKDIPEYIHSGYKASDEMRAVRFNTWDRLVLTPLEFVQGFKYVFILMVVFFVLSGLNSSGYSINMMLNTGKLSIIALMTAYIAGTIFTPLLLPWFTTPAFAAKGFYVMVPLYIIMYQIFPEFQTISLVEKFSWFFIMTPISSFFAMNFTGASTYTSLSGVKKEMKYAVPLQIISLVTGFILWMVKRFF